MKRLVSLVVFGFVLAAPILKIYAQKSFEGTITWSMTIPQLGDDDKHQMVVNVKDKKTETEMDMGAMGVMKTYSNDVTKKTYMMMGGMNFVTDMPSDSDSKNAALKPDALDLKPSGKKETIAGHPAEEYLLTGVKARGANIDMSIWVASDFPKDIQESFYHSMKNQAGQDPKQGKAMKQLAEKGLVPVRIVTKTGGETMMTMEFVKYEKKNLDDALFVPPADIKFQPMPKGPAGGGMN